MRVAGFGFRKSASLSSLQDALSRAGGGLGLDAIATADDKALAPVFCALAQALDLPVAAIPQTDISAANVITHSPNSQAARAIGSLSEAAALAGAGAGAILLGPRQISTDKLATCAIAEGAAP